MKFYFRALLIVDYDIEKRELTITDDFKMCKFIPEDYKLLAEFFDTIYKLQTGIAVPEEKLQDIEVY